MSTGKEVWLVVAWIIGASIGVVLGGWILGTALMVGSYLISVSLTVLAMAVWHLWKTRPKV